MNCVVLWFIFYCLFFYHATVGSVILAPSHFGALVFKRAGDDHVTNESLEMGNQRLVIEKNDLNQLQITPLPPSALSVPQTPHEPGRHLNHNTALLLLVHKRGNEVKAFFNKKDEREQLCADFTTD